MLTGKSEDREDPGSSALVLVELVWIKIVDIIVYIVG